MNTKYILRKISLIIALLIISHSSIALVSWTLDNGLKLIVKPDNRAKVFIMQVWYDVGSSNEAKGETGISHLLEHLMFKGTNDLAAGEFSQIIANNGGQDNAFTSKDFTAYYQKMGSDKLEIAFKLEADRMQNLSLKAQDLATERQVVLEERRLRVEDNPVSKAYELLRKSIYDKKGAYHYPVIGLQKDLENISLSQLKNWYKTYYAVNNANIVVVGDVSPSKTLALAKKYFAHLKPVSTKPKPTPSIPVINTYSSITLKTKLPLYVMSYAVPSIGSIKNEATKRQAYALEVLAYLLNGNNNALLDQALIYQNQLVSSVDVYYNLYDKYQTGFIINWRAISAADNNRIKSIILDKINLLKTKPISAKDLEIIKAQTRASYIYEQDSISSQAYYLGALETIGIGFKAAAKYSSEIAKVTGSDIKQVINNFFKAQQLSQLEVVPNL